MGEVRTASTGATSSALSVERKRGSDCTGANNAVNRTLVLASTPTNLLVFKNGQLLTLTTDYTISVATITFIFAVSNDDYITAEYDA